ncbi:MAG: head-tail connector protein [Roseitalea porphyridii]|uniref:head-tail connector protein n=1 Tax=Hyphomicrobiales TaxID=356 RepID=UPI0032EDA011
MAIATFHQLSDQLSLTTDVLAYDGNLLQDKLDAAQAYIERMLGFRIEEEFGGEDQDPIPPDLVEAVLQLAAWWYEQRETALTGTIVAEVPFGVQEIITAYREFTF